MSDETNSQNAKTNRSVMMNAGWVYANEGLPGVYVPGPDLSTQVAAKDWAVTNDELITWIERVSANNPEFKKILCE